MWYQSGADAVSFGRGKGMRLRKMIPVKAYYAVSAFLTIKTFYAPFYLIQNQASQV